MSKTTGVEKRRVDRCRDIIDILEGDLARAEEIFAGIEGRDRNRGVCACCRNDEDRCNAAALAATRALRWILERYRYALQAREPDDFPF